MLDFERGAETGTTVLHSQPHIFHCNHYNAFLQRTILDPDYIDCRPLLRDAATAAAYSQLITLMQRREAAGFFERLELAAMLFQHCGFGVLDFSTVTDQGGTVTSRSSHYSLAWKNKFGIATEPMALFDAGYIAAAVAAAAITDVGTFDVQQTRCVAKGDSQNEYVVSRTPGRRIYADVGLGVTQVGYAPPRSLENNIDEDGIVSALMNMPIAGNEEGLIPAFGVVLTRMYANYYNRVSFGFEESLGRAAGDDTLGALLLIEAGHSCAFNTFGGVMKSDEWYGLIAPMCQNREDWVHGIVAAVNSFGWGVWRVHELVPNKRLVIRVYNGYEANGYLAMYGKSRSPKSYLATGGTAGIMNLLYHIDITQKPDLSSEYYESAFSGKGAFSAHQSQCRAMGDRYDEFIAERN